MAYPRQPCDKQLARLSPIRPVAHPDNTRHGTNRAHHHGEHHRGREADDQAVPGRGQSCGDKEGVFVLEKGVLASDTGAVWLALFNGRGQRCG